MEIGRTDRLLLRTVEASDRDEIVAMHVAGQTVERWGPPLAPGLSFDQMVDGWLNADPARSVRFVAECTDAADGPRLACIVALSEIVRGVFQNAFIGWRTHPLWLGRGYCTETVRLVLDHAFAEGGLKLHRVQASIAPDNLASCRVAEKCGFRREGIASRYLHVRGEWRDHLIYAMTTEDR